jgi:hypothetical protein
VAWSRPASSDSGYATPAAVVISLSLAIVATAVSNRSLAALELARADFERTRAEDALGGVQQGADLTIMQAPRAAPFQWTTPSDLGPADVLAEPEAPKLTLAAAAELDDASLSRFGVRDPAALRARLKTLALDNKTDANLEDADASPLWASCAPSIISQDGTAIALPAISPKPLTGGGSGQGRLGEVWRIRTASSHGWVDERTVRFTGDLTNPARTIRRRLFKTSIGDGQCDALFKPAR